VTTATTSLPVDELRSRALTARPARVLLTVIAAIGMVLGFVPGWILTRLGWLAGRIWLIGAYAVEAVVYGFKAGSTLRSAPPSPQPPRQPE
jgi:hypothetical protein